MRFAIDISPAGEWGNPRELAKLAALAEQSGWDGVFLEDYVFYPGGLDTYDPWISLAAIALATERIRLGTENPPTHASGPPCSTRRWTSSTASGVVSRSATTAPTSDSKM